MATGFTTSVYFHGDYADQSQGLFLVTGASGFIASQIVALLLHKGYRVRGTVRNLTNEVKVNPLRELSASARHPLELIEANLNQPDSWDNAVNGCKYVFHVASPFPGPAPKYETDITGPAINGTLSVLAACHKHRVKRVVLTSSIAAIFGDLSERGPPEKILTENDWTRDPEHAKDAYVKSKTLAEMAAWNFVAQLPADERFELAVVNPTYVLGPLLCGVVGTTGLIVKKLMDGSIPLVPKLNYPFVDVRDVALGQLRAMTLPQTVGQRQIIHSGHNLWMLDIAHMLDAEFRSQGYHIPLKESPHLFLKLDSLFDKTVARALPLENKVQLCDDTKMRTVLGITAIELNKSVLDMAYSLIERGFLKKTHKFRPRPIINPYT